MYLVFIDCQSISDAFFSKGLFIKSFNIVVLVDLNYKLSKVNLHHLCFLQSIDYKFCCVITKLFTWCKLP